MFTSLYDAVRRRGDARVQTGVPCDPCSRSVDEAVDYAIDATSSRIRAVSGHTRRLRGPLANALSYIGDLADQISPALTCQPRHHDDDPRVGALFVERMDLQGLFSADERVQRYFAAHPEADSCVAVLSSARSERRQLGMALVDDRVHRDVMQTVVCFRDHQLLAPGRDEAEARTALKCWMFENLIAHATAFATQAHTRRADLEGRARGLRTRLRRLPSGSSQGRQGSQRGELEREVAALEGQIELETVAWVTPHQQLAFLIDVLDRPERFLTLRNHRVFLDRIGIKYAHATGPLTFAMPLQEVSVGSHGPRTLTLIRFPREGLLPARDFVTEVSRFLTGGGNLQ